MGLFSYDVRNLGGLGFCDSLNKGNFNAKYFKNSKILIYKEEMTLIN